MDQRNNLLVALHKWARRQDENFLTEAFAHLLQHLLDEEPVAAVGLLKALTNGFLKVSPDDAKTVIVRTQIVTGEGTPDMQLRTARQLVFVEVKSESIATPQQIEKYRDLLQGTGVKDNCLVLLTRYPAVFPNDSSMPDVFARWHQVADWIEHERVQYAFKAVSGYLAQQFLEFLGVRNMTIAQVTWELGSGIRALQNFVDMLLEAGTACGVRTTKYAVVDGSGVYLDGKNYWVGIDFNNPEVLRFSTNNRPVRKELAETLGMGWTSQWSTDKTRFKWVRDLDLKSEEVHFYARSRASQMQFLEEFIRESLTLARQVEDLTVPEDHLDAGAPS